MNMLILLINRGLGQGLGPPHSPHTRNTKWLTLSLYSVYAMPWGLQSISIDNACKGMRALSLSASSFRDLNHEIAFDFVLCVRLRDITNNKKKLHSTYKHTRLLSFLTSHELCFWCLSNVTHAMTINMRWRSSCSFGEKHSENNGVRKILFAL